MGKSFWEVVGEVMNQPIFVGKNAKKDYKEYMELKHADKIIHLHQHNYYLIEKATGRRIDLNPEDFEIHKEDIDEDAREE